jgi:hypothetical protein
VSRSKRLCKAGDTHVDPITKSLCTSQGGFAALLKYLTDKVPNKRTMFAYPRCLASAFFGSGLRPRRRAPSPSAQASWRDDRRKRQTSTATPAEPGDLPWVLAVESVNGTQEFMHCGATGVRSIAAYLSDQTTAVRLATEGPD